MTSRIQLITGVELGREQPKKSMEEAILSSATWSGKMYGLGNESERKLGKLAEGLHRTQLNALIWAVDVAYEKWFMESLLGTSPAEDAMSDKPKPWPYDCADARDRAAEETVKAIKLLEPVNETEKDLEIMRRVDRAMISLFTAIRLLESVGAKTRP